MENKKIMLVAEFGTFGGPLTNFKKLVNLYKENNYNVKIILRKDNFNNDIKKFVEDLGFGYYIIRNFSFLTKLKSKYFNSVKSLIDLIEIFFIFLKERPKLVVVSTGSPASFLSLILLPSKFIYTLRSYPVNGSKFSLKSIFLNMLLGKGKRIVTVSDFARKNIIKHWNIEKKQEYINFIYNSSDKTIPEVYEYQKNNKNLILTIGHLRWYKNPELWFYTATKVLNNLDLKEIKFVWIGDGELFDTYDKKIKELKLNNIECVGYKNNIEEYLKKTLIYFQPSLVESHGLSVLDAMRHGIPCVVSNIGGLPESVINNETGFVIDVKDKDEFAKKIILLLKDAELREKFGKAGLERYKNNFSYEIWENKIVNLHNEMLNL